MSKQTYGQMSIFDIHTDHNWKPCEYRFKRYIGQRVRSKSKYGVQYIGTIVSMEPYYTNIRTDDGREIVGTPYDVEPVKTCATCYHYKTYVDSYTCEPLGKICVKDRPYGTIKLDDDTCEGWEEK